VRIEKDANKAISDVKQNQEKFFMKGKTSAAELVLRVVLSTGSM
jgi:hypothetical protein